MFALDPGSQAALMSGLLGRVAYKPVGLLLGAAARRSLRMIFKQIWKHLADESDAPNATDEERGWGEILVAAALQDRSALW